MIWPLIKNHVPNILPIIIVRLDANPSMPSVRLKAFIINIERRYQWDKCFLKKVQTRKITNPSKLGKSQEEKWR